MSVSDIRVLNDKLKITVNRIVGRCENIPKEFIDLLIREDGSKLAAIYNDDKSFMWNVVDFYFVNEDNSIGELFKSLYW